MSTKKIKNKSSIITSPVDSAAKPADDGYIAADHSALKEETLRWVLSIIGAIVVYVVVANMIYKSYHPDIKTLFDQANIFSFAGGDSRPEPVEGLLFRMAIITIVSCILGFYFLFSKLQLIKEWAQKPFFTVITALCAVCIALLIYFDFTALNPFRADGDSGIPPQHSRDFAGKSNFDFFFLGNFLGDHLLLYVCVLFPLIVGLFYFGIRKNNWENNSLFRRVSSIVGYGVIGATILAIVLIHTFDFPYQFENKYDFNAVYYSMTQVYAGVPMLVDGFSNTYGLYPHFLNLILHFTGLSIFNFSLIMALLLGGSYLFNFLLLKHFVRNNIILILGMTTVFFFPFLNNKLVNAFDCLFSMFPVRYVIPSTLTFLAMLYLKNRSQVIYWSIFIIMGCFLLWNPEFGMVCFMAWIAFNVYNDFYTADGKVAIKRIVLHIASGAGTVVVVLSGYKFLIHLFYGSWPDLQLLFGYVVIFGKLGIGNLPMVLVHPWNLTAIIIISGFTYAIVKWYRKEITPKASMIFLVTIIGVGFFIYFQGRSHNWPYASSTCFSFILLTILGDELWEKIKNTNIIPLHLLFGLFLFVSSYSFFEILYNAKKMSDLVYMEDDKEKQLPEQEQIMRNYDFIVKNSAVNEKIFLLTSRQYQGYYLNGNKRRSAFNPGMQDFFLNSDLTKMEDRIIDSSFTVFLEPTLCQLAFMVRPLAAVGATYELKTVHESMDLLKKRTLKVPSKSYLGSAGNVVLHRKYSDDTTGAKLRISDAMGLSPVSLSPEFSVELIFNPATQVYQYATLIGNMTNTSGFTICNIINSTDYILGINGKTMKVPMPATKWVYFVMNVFPDKIDVYENGAFLTTLAMGTPYQQSAEKLFIGNQNFLRYFLGAISEVNISNKAVDKDKIKATWDEISRE